MMPKGGNMMRLTFGGCSKKIKINITKESNIDRTRKTNALGYIEKKNMVL